MSGIRLELGNPNEYSSVSEYIEKHLAPVATELHRITAELMSPGFTSTEDWAVDMIPEVQGSSIWMRLDYYLAQTAKAVFFDGSSYFTLPKELLRAKQVKVQLVFTGYAHGEKDLAPVEFRLTDADGNVIEHSNIQTDSFTPVTIVRNLPFGEGKGCIVPRKMMYFVEGRSMDRQVTPACRRLSLSFVYI